MELAANASLKERRRSFSASLETLLIHRVMGLHFMLFSIVPMDSFFILKCYTKNVSRIVRSTCSFFFCFATTQVVRFLGAVLTVQFFTCSTDFRILQNLSLPPGDSEKTTTVVCFKPTLKPSHMGMETTGTHDFRPEVDQEVGKTLYRHGDSGNDNQTKGNIPVQGLYEPYGLIYSCIIVVFSWTLHSFFLQVLTVSAAQLM